MSRIWPIVCSVPITRPHLSSFLLTPRLGRLAAAAVLLCLPGCGGGSGSGAKTRRARSARRGDVLRGDGASGGSAARERAGGGGQGAPHAGSEARIEQLVEQVFPDSSDPELDYARDVKPWLGAKAGFWLAAAGKGEEPRGAAILSATDTDAAQAAIDRGTQSSDETFTR
jgi:hypothetical protein